MIRFHRLVPWRPSPLPGRPDGHLDHPLELFQVLLTDPLSRSEVFGTRLPGRGPIPRIARRRPSRRKSRQSQSGILKRITSKISYTRSTSSEAKNLHQIEISQAHDTVMELEHRKKLTKEEFDRVASEIRALVGNKMMNHKRATRNDYCSKRDPMRIRDAFVLLTS